MSLTDRDIALFARDCVAEDSLCITDDAMRARLETSAKRAAMSYLNATEQAIRSSGYRITNRVRARIIAELSQIQTLAHKDAAQ